MVSVLSSSAVDRGFEPRSGQTKHYKIGMCCFSAKHTVLGRKSNDWLAWNQDNVSEWGDISINGLLIKWASTLKILSVLVEYKANIIIISQKNCSRHEIAENVLSWRYIASTHSNEK